jgi:hypothetical protein
MLKTILISIIFSFLIFNKIYASGNHSNRVDYHAPITIMNDHSHKKGEIMLSYRYLEMKMSGLKNGSEDISNSDALSNYMMIPSNMRMKMHMLGAMYGFTDNLTIILAGSLIKKEMQLLNSSYSISQRQSNGYGDTKLGSIIKLHDDNKQELIMHNALSIPTGSIDEKHNSSKLPYSMQIGSGSYDLNTGLTYKIFHNKYSFGNQISGLFRMNNNDSGYKFGDQYDINSWITHKINNNSSISARIHYQKTESIEGKDVDITKMMITMPTQDPSLYSKEIINIALGGNYLFTKNNLKGNRLAFEIIKPIYQKLDGPQMKFDYKIVIGWQRLF